MARHCALPPRHATGSAVSAQWTAALAEAWRRGRWNAVYQQYTQSAPYVAFRQQLRQAVGKPCQRCARDDARLYLHHLHYRTAGSERLHDVRLLCEACVAVVSDPTFRGTIPPCAAQRESAKAAHEALRTPAPKKIVRRRPAAGPVVEEHLAEYA